MEESKWIKQISKDNSIQLLLCEHFINPTINDCVVVGNSSIRLLIIQSNQIKEIARYDHQLPIISACITYNGEQPEIAFISGTQLYFMLPHTDSLEITNIIPLDYKYSFITSNFTTICLYPRDSTLTFYTRSTNSFTNFTLPNDTKIWSSTFLNDYLVTLEYQNVFKVKIYKSSNLDAITTAASFVVNYFTPYRLISVPSHSSVYLLCESALIQLKQAQSGWSLSKFQLGIRRADSLAVDAAPCGVRLLLLTAGFAVLRFDGSRFEHVGDFPGASCIACVTLTRFVLALDGCRVRLCDASLQAVHEVSRAACSSAGYAHGSLTVSTSHAVHSVFFDYGIEIERSAAVEFGSQPRVVACKDCCFVLFSDRTVVLDAEFRDVTPSAVKRRAFDRVHATSRHSFFAATRDELFAFEFGSLASIVEESDASDSRLNQIVAVSGRVISLHTYCHSAIIKNGAASLRSCATAVSFAGSIVVSLFSDEVAILDDELSEVKCVNVGFTAFSIVYDGYRFLIGSGDGRIACADSGFEKVKLFDSPIGVSTVHLVCSVGEVTAMCDNRFFHIKDTTVSELPTDFLFFGGFVSHGNFLGLLKKEKRGEPGHLVTARLADRLHGVVSAVVFEFNRRVTRLCASRRGRDFACCVAGSSLFWSRGSVTFDLSEGEEVKSITEWKAKHKAKVIQFWMVCTERRATSDSRLIIFNQSASTNKVTPLLEKVFRAPITAFAVSSPSLSFFSMSGTITGISLETGSLTQRGESHARIADVSALDATDGLLAALAERNEFAVFRIGSAGELSLAACVRRPALFGRIKIIGDAVAVSSRVQPAMYVYRLVTQGGGDVLSIVREVNFMSPVTSIFSVNGRALCTCVCGEVTLVSCSSEDELSDMDVSKLFSFSQSALSV